MIKTRGWSTARDFAGISAIRQSWKKALIPAATVSLGVESWSMIVCESVIGCGGWVRLTWRVTGSVHGAVKWALRTSAFRWPHEALGLHVVEVKGNLISADVSNRSKAPQQLR